MSFEEGTVLRTEAVTLADARAAFDAILLPGADLTLYPVDDRAARPRLVDRYRDFLPITDATPWISLGRGSRRFVRLGRLGAELGLHNFYAKVEGTNPTGSFKDRGMVGGFPKASTRRAPRPSSAPRLATLRHRRPPMPPRPGSTRRSCSRAARSRRQAAPGARRRGAVVAIDGNFDQALAIVRALAEQDDNPVTLVNSVNPYRIHGQRTAAFEVCDDLDARRTSSQSPSATRATSARQLGLGRDYASAGRISSVPRMRGFQAAGAAPLVTGQRVDHPETVATAIRIGDPASGTMALAARDESGGVIEAVTDDEILAAYRDLARLEGIFCEPSSAAGVAGVRRAATTGRIEPDAVIVCVLTGHGAQGPDDRRGTGRGRIEAEATVGSVAVALGW